MTASPVLSRSAFARSDLRSLVRSSVRIFSGLTLLGRLGERFQGIWFACNKPRSGGFTCDG
jgi:hypothetical protein